MQRPEPPRNRPCMMRNASRREFLGCVGAAALALPAAACARPAVEPAYDDLLRPGATADVSVLDVTNEPIDLVDSNGDVRTGAQQLRPVATVKSGRLVMTQGIDIG